MGVSISQLFSIDLLSFCSCAGHFEGTVSWLQFILIARFEADKTLSNLEPILTYKDFSQVDMVIEAIFEDIKIKHAVLKEVEQVKTSFILAIQKAWLVHFSSWTTHWSLPSEAVVWTNNRCQRDENVFYTR